MFTRGTAHKPAHQSRRLDPTVQGAPNVNRHILPVLVACGHARRPRRVNLWFGVKDLAFAIGDDSIADFVLSIQFMPVIRMVSSST